MAFLFPANKVFMSLSELKYFKVTNSTTIFSSKPWKQISCIPVAHKVSTSKSSLYHHVHLYFSLVPEKCLTGTSRHDPESCKSTPGRPQLGKFHTGSAQQAAHLATEGFPPREPSLSSAPHQAMRSMAHWVPASRSRGLAEWNSYRRCGEEIWQQGTSAAPCSPREQGHPPPSWEGVESWAPSPAPPARSDLNSATHHLKSPLPQQFLQKGYTAINSLAVLLMVSLRGGGLLLRWQVRDNYFYHTHLYHNPTFYS